MALKWKRSARRSISKLRWRPLRGAAFLLVACVLAMTACSDSPRRTVLSESAKADGADGAQATDERAFVPLPDPAEVVCPQVGEDASPLPEALPAEATVQAGAIAGSFSVSSTGEAGYSMPLSVPPGRAGMQPALSVTYDSSAGAGTLGMGFGISGLSVVTRCPRNIAQDGEIRAVRDDAGDAFCLDGKRLVAVGERGDRVEYRTFPDTFARVIADYAGSDREKGPKSFTSFTKSGLIVDYGGTPSGRVLAQRGVIRSWAVTRTSDRYGNTIDTTWWNEKHPTEGYTIEHAPLRIDYTGHPSAPASRAVAFVYDTKESDGGRILFARGMALRNSWRLKQVKMLGPGDALVREYRFHYGAGPATGRQVLEEIRECAGDGACKPGTRFTWHHGTGTGFTWMATPIPLPTSERAGVMMIDATGDGKDDLLITDVDPLGSDDYPMTDWLLSPNIAPNSSPFNAQGLAHQQIHAEPPTPFQPDLGTPIDVNQDGMTDVFLHDVHGQYPHWNVLLAGPGGTLRRHDTGIARQFGLGPPPPLHMATPGGSAHLADVSGDGISDLILCGGNGIDFDWTLHLWRPEGPGFDVEPSRIQALHWYPCDAELHTVDVDSDGKIELLVQTARETSNGAIFGTTYDALTFVRPNEWSRQHTGLSAVLPGGHLVFLDVNGDGLSDAIESGFGDLQLRTFINTGAGFSAAQSSLAAVLAEADTLIKLAAPIDFNGDGRQDLLIPMRAPGEAPAWKVLQSTGSVGDGTFTIVDSTLPLARRILDEEITLANRLGPRVTDLDGDGVQDVLLPVHGFFRAFTSRLQEEDLLESVTDGLNALEPGDTGFLPNVQIAYSHLSAVKRFALEPPDEEKTYLPQVDPLEDPSSYPVHTALGPRRVVSGYVLNNGANQARHFQVAYRGGRYHRLGRGFLGFGERIVRDLDTGSGTAEYYDNVTFDGTLNAFPYAGQVVRERRWNPTQNVGAKSSSVELLYGTTLLLTEKNNGGATYFTVPVLHRERRAQGEYTPNDAQTLEQYVEEAERRPALNLSETTKTAGDYDHFGNILEERTVTAGVDLSLRVKRGFDIDEGHWRIGELRWQTECSSAASIEQCRTTRRRYDAAGQIRVESAGSDDGDQETSVRVEYARDGFGNIVRTTAEEGFGSRRESCTSYDAEGIFPYATRNPAGHLSFMKFDPGLGVQTAAVDPNGLATRWAHDGLGRVTRELRADTTATTYALTRTRDGGALHNEWNLKIETRTDGGGDDIVQLDSLGRPVRWWTQRAQVGSNAAERIVQEIAFDRTGEHVARRSVPTGETTPAARIQYDRYLFDAMGRVVAHTTPWHALTATRYLGTTVQVTSPGTQTTIENDPLGRPVSITDAENGVTRYVYGPFGGLLSVTAPGGASTITRRDAYGRVRTRVDPDRGTTIAHYNGFGQRTSSTDALNRRIAWTYDRLGRATVRVDDDGTTRWTWDSAAHGVGQLAEVESPGGHKETYGYDELSRPQSTRLRLDGETFTASIGYDAFSRPDILRYPGGGDRSLPFTVRRDYDAHGALVGVRDAWSGRPYWQLSATDSAGRNALETFGNEVTTARSYNAKGLLDTLFTTHDGTTLQFMDYDYDDRLNLRFRDDARTGKAEYFDHDRLDRVTCAYQNAVAGCREPVTYAPSGNLLSKPGLGTYTYDLPQPHAVHTIGTDRYGYNAVGNQTSRPGARIDYTAFDLPKTFTLDGGAGTVELDYDGNQARIRKTTPTDVTVTLGDLYERVTDRTTGAIEHRYTVHAGERAVAIVTRGAGAPNRKLYLHADHLGSVEVLTDADGNEVERRSYDAFGARRNPIWGAPEPASFASQTTPGFTGHASDDDLGLINMKGRLYDPKAGRFLTPDPIVSKPHFSQSWNAYSYVLNGPLSYVDPSGFQEAPAGDGSPVEGLAPLVVYVVGPPPPWRKGDDAEDKKAGQAEVGESVAPIDVSFYGVSAGFVPQAASLIPEQGTLGPPGEIGIGVAEGTGLLAVGVSRSLVLNALTFGGYGTYEFGRAIWDGYKEDGFLGALNAANPLYQIGKGGADTYLAVDRGDYRAAGASGAATALLGVAAVVGPRREFILLVQANEF